MTSTNTPTKRYLALDVLRGMTVAGMILVNNPGSWSHIYPPLEHAPWTGCTPTDLVFPFFLFVVGAAMAFSFAKYFEGSHKGAYAKLYRRSGLIFLVGLLLNAFPFFPFTAAHYESLRLFGVLQRIALSYALGGTLALWLMKPKRIGAAFALLLLVYWGLLYFAGGPEPYTLQGYLGTKVDLALIGPDHMYKGYGEPFDPEGLLGMISGAGTVLMGYLAGHLIRVSKEKIDAVGRLFVAGMISLGTACVWSIWLPVSKPMWTGSYVLYAGGWTLLMLGFFVYWIDIRGKEKWFFPFKTLGLNPLFAFVMAGLFSKILGRLVHWQAADGSSYTALSWLYRNVFVAVFGPGNLGSLMYALCYVLIFTLMAIGLYKKKIIIKL